MTRPGKNKKGQAATTHCKGLKQQTSQLEQNNAYFLEKVRDAEAWSQPGGYDRRSKCSG
ncbi:hypothetical protein SFK304_4921 [Shigella flexneri K-304]|nr:hypothetical protein SFK304_4921 [Shigella flexneri K-304]